MYGAVAAAIVVGMIMGSFYHLEMPAESRERKIDEKVLGMLQDMQWRTEDYYRTNKALPADLDTLYGEFPVPSTPTDRSAIGYEVTGDTTYKLCGEFAQNSYEEQFSQARPMYEKNYNWEYKAGEWCFEREIDEVYTQ
jgi:hypothetical protein